MFEESNILDKFGFYKQADEFDKKVMSENNFILKKKKKNPFLNINIQLQNMKNRLNQIEDQFVESIETVQTKKEKPNSFQTNNINYLSNAPIDIDNIGNNNDTNIKVE